MDDQIEDDILRRLTPPEKLAVMNGLIRQAYALKAAGIRMLHPDLPEDEVRQWARAAVGGDGS